MCFNLSSNANNRWINNHNPFEQLFPQKRDKNRLKNYVVFQLIWNHVSLPLISLMLEVEALLYSMLPMEMTTIYILELHATK